MEEVVLVIHLILALSIIALVLLQRSEGGGLGVGSGGGMGALASAHTTANVLSRATAICATGFFITSITLAILAGHHSRSVNLLDTSAPAATSSLTPPVAGKAIGNQPMGNKPSSDPSAPAIVPEKAVDAPKPVAAAPAAPPQPAAPISK